MKGPCHESGFSSRPTGGRAADHPTHGRTATRRTATRRTAAPLSGATGTPVPLTAVEVSPQGTSYGTPSGTATISYHPAAQTLKVTVTASGVSPGTHAAHIHIGSCASQGPVQYMLTDFTANSAGQIVSQTRTLSHVTTPVPAGGWYLNLHQGNSNTIVQNGQPTIFFRPLLCADI